MQRRFQAFTLSSLLGTVLFTACQTTSPADASTQLSDSALAANWTPVGPGGGGAFNSPVISPTGTWAIGSDLGGVCFSSNSGQSWTVIGSQKGLKATHVAAMAASPSNGRILVGTDDGLYLLSPNGSTATLVRSGGYISAIAFAPANPNIVYAVAHPQWNGVGGVMLRSDDNGSTWRTTGNIPANLRIVGLRVHPIDYDAVLMISGEGRFADSPKEAWLSLDNGATWGELNPGNEPVVDMVYAQNSDNMNRMYMTTSTDSYGNGKLYRSENAGGTWTLVAAETGVILADSSTPGRIRLLNPTKWKPWNNTGILESTNWGTTWKVMGSSNTWPQGWSKRYASWGFGSSYQGLLQTYANRGTTLISTDNQFVFASSNGGISLPDISSNPVTTGTWKSRGCDNTVPAVVTPSSADSNLVYVGYHDLGLFRSDDGGNSWIPLNDPQYSGSWLGYGGNTLSVVADPTRANVVWAQLAGGLNGRDTPTSEYEITTLARSTQRGAIGSWRVATGLPSQPRMISGLSVDPRSSSTNRRLFAIVDGNVYRSVNDGMSFALVHSCNCSYTWVAGNYVFAGGGSGLWRSSIGDSGTWTAVTSGLPATSGWTANLDPFYSWFSGVTDLAVNPTSTSEIWLALRGYGFYRSTNSGTSWSLVRSDALARTVTVDSTGLVLIGSSSATTAGGYSASSFGVMKATRNTNGTFTWTADNPGLAYPFATYMRVSSAGVRWLISPGQGVLKR